MRDILYRLPDDRSAEDFKYSLGVDENVRCRLELAERAEVVPQTEAEQRLERWLVKQSGCAPRSRTSTPSRPYLAADSPAYAAAAVSRVLAAARGLSKLPLLGRRLPEADDDRTREQVVHSYRLVYPVRGDIVVVFAVIHGARLLLDSLREGSE